MAIFRIDPDLPVNICYHSYDQSCAQITRILGRLGKRLNKRLVNDCRALRIELHSIREGDGALTLGAAVTYTEAREPIVRHFPQLTELWDRIGGGQVRNAGTIGANIANGSPIGDTPPPLIALGAHDDVAQGQARREVKLKDFFIAYGKQDRQPGEFVESVTIPYLPVGRAAGLLQDHQAQGRGYLGALRRVPGVRQRRRPGRHGADRLRRHGGNAEARQGGGGRR